jgi:excisionase family DNA binding protein
MTYNYKTIPFPIDGNLTSILESHGRDGLRLCATYPCLVFMRSGFNEAEPGPAPKRAKEPGVLLTVTEAASWLGVGRSKIYGLMLAGTLKSVRLGSRSRRVRVDDRRQFISNLSGGG